jgi:hypothetical protein
MSEANAMILSTDISVELSLHRSLKSQATAYLKTEYPQNLHCGKKAMQNVVI